MGRILIHNRTCLMSGAHFCSIPSISFSFFLCVYNAHDIEVDEKLFFSKVIAAFDALAETISSCKRIAESAKFLLIPGIILFIYLFIIFLWMNYFQCLVY